MEHKINKRARKSRFGRTNLKNTSVLSMYGFNGVFIIIVFLLPFYPTFASLFYGNTQYEFYRGNIDESSILEAYSLNPDSKNKNIIIESEDSFLSVNTTSNDERDLSGTNEISSYEIKYGDSISAIAYKFKVSNNSIYWANNFDKKHVIQPGDKIKIPPVSGVIYKIEKGDTLSSISKKYKVEEKTILEQNLMESKEDIIAGEVLVIPGASKYIEKPVYKAPVYTKNTTKTTKTSKGGYSFAKVSSSSYSNSKGVYKLTPKPRYHTFYWGNCTWYVAKYKSVNWGGNAKDWLRNAQNKGHATGSKPVLGAIVVYNGRGYNPRYGHVAIVMEIQKNHMIVSDMNYRRLGEVTYRKVPLNDRAIKGYIYVN